MSLWQLHNLLPKGALGVSQPLWPGRLAALFLILGVAYGGLVWLHINRSLPDRYRRAALAALALACFGLVDWALLAALPRLDLSFGPLTFPLIAITGVRLAVFTVLALPLCLWSSLASQVQKPVITRKLLNLGLVCLWLANLALLAVELDGLYIEPFDIHTTELRLADPTKASGEPLRIVHLTDLHIERITRRELELIERVKALQPDLILMTGDYANVDYLEDARTLRDTRSILSQLSATYGVYAVIGSVDGPHVMEKVFTGLPITVLKDEVHPLQIGGREIDLIGVSNFGPTRDGQILSALMQQVPLQAYSILLYHTPDLIEVADRLQIDLYLAGHTHGGQVRLPLWGAIITMSAFGKQYESGLYRLTATTLYVSRGIGLEGLSLPRARFLCPPELVVIDLGNEGAPVTGNFSLDWLTLAVSLFNTILLLWLGLTVLLNAERRPWGIWMAGGGLLTGAAFFMIHTVILGLGFEHFGWAVNFWWRLGWIPVILAPFAWYLVMLWYTGYWEGRENPIYRRHRFWLGLLLVTSLVMMGMFIFANPLPSIIQMTHLDLNAQPAIFGVPVLLFLYPLFILGCIGLSLEALLQPGPTMRLMGHLARQRARPWLSAASFFLLLVSLLVAGFMAWVVLSARYTTPFLSLARAAAWLDLAIETLIAGSVVLTGQAIVTYEIFTGKALPRRGLLRFWQRALILAAGYSLLVGFSATLQIASIYSLLVSTALLVLFYALLSWRSYAEREHFIDLLRPFITSQQLYDQLLETPDGQPVQEAEPPFRALCSQVLDASRAALIPLGPLATLFGPALAYPDSKSAPALKIVELAAKATPDTLYLPLEEGEACEAVWAIPLWNGRGLCGILALGEKQDNGLYTQEEIEIARTAGERLVDLQASSEISRRLMALQRRQLAESQVLDRRARRVLHDDVLPQLHTILLSLSAANPGGETSEAQTLLAGVHRQISDLLRDLPAAAPPELRRLGLAAALQRVVEDELRPAFDEVSWQAAPQAVQAASELQPMQAEVVYYAAREVVRNAARHARPAGSNLPLRLEAQLNWNEGLEIVIQDNGVGLDRANGTQAGSGQGLALHSTLLAVIGGSLTVESEPGAYTRVRIYLPGAETT